MTTEDEAAPRCCADVMIIGGCKRVGRPSGAALASPGLSVRRCGLSTSASGAVNPEAKGGRL